MDVRQAMLGLLLLAVSFTAVLGVSIDTYPSSVEAGKSYTITYSPKDQPATFVLRKGSSTNLGTVGTLGTGNAGSFTWTVSSTLASGNDYALEAKQGSEINFSAQFSLSGGSSGAASSAVVPIVQVSDLVTPARSTTVPSSNLLPPPTTSSAPIPRLSSPAASSVPSSIALNIQSVTSSGTSISSTSPTGSSASIGNSASATPADTTSGGSSQNGSGSSSGGLTTGEKAGIGVGVSIGGLLLAFGAFFLGMSVRKKAKKNPDAEAGSVPGKPELDGKAAYHEKGKPDVESGMIPVVSRESGDSSPNAPKAFELGGQTGQPTTRHTELTAEPRGVEMDSSHRGVEMDAPNRGVEMDTATTQQPRHELHGTSPVSPVSESQTSGPTRRDTYDDPRLVQNPWAQDEGRQVR